MSGNLTLAMRLLLDSREFTNKLTGSGRQVKVWGQGVRTELRSVGDVWNKVTGIQGKIAAVGATLGATAAIIQSAGLDKKLRQVELTAGAGSGQIVELRKELFSLSKQTGRTVADLTQGVGNLVASGLSLDESLQTIRATSKAMAVADANADSLTSALSVAAAQFDFDLSKPQAALDILDKMVVAGRLGNAELENLSSIFARVGGSGRAAGMGFEQTLAFIEGLSIIERQPERLATLADSTLRLFTNARYRKAAQTATGVKFFDAQGAARDPLSVLGDLRGKFQVLQTDRARANFIFKAFGNTDLDTQRGLRMLLSGSALNDVQSFSARIGSSSGTIDKDLKHAIDNSVDQVGRLKGALQEAADGFAKHLNRGISSAIRKLMDQTSEGGWNLSGNQMIAGGVGLAAATYLAMRAPGGIARRLARRAGGIATGVAAGKALETAGAATPVFVVNMPNGGIAGGGTGATDALLGAGAGAAAAKVFGGWRAGAGMLAAAPSMAAIKMMGWRGVTAAGGAAGVAGALGYGAGSLLYNMIDETTFADKLGESIARALGFLGLDSARDAVAAREKLDASLRITIDDKTGAARVTAMSSNERNALEIERLGYAMGPGY